MRSPVVGEAFAAPVDVVIAIFGNGDGQVQKQHMSFA